MQTTSPSPTPGLVRRLWQGLRLRRGDTTADFTRTSDECRRLLAQTTPGLEHLFLEIGQCLDPLSTGSQALVDECETLLHLASGRENGQNLLQDTLAVLAGPLAYIDACLQQRERLVTLLTTCERQTAAMIRIRSDMHDTLAPLAYLTVLFKIESARLPADMQETFATVTREIERMRQIVDETFSQNARMLSEAQGTLATVRAHLEADFKLHAAELVEKREKIQTAITTLDEQLAHNNERDLRMHSQSRVIAAEVGRIIQGLQFQDIIQQKCAHVIGELGHEDFSHGADAARLQACQLDAVCDDLATGLDQIQSGLDNINLETNRFDEICLKLDGLEGMVAAADGMVQLLLDVLEDVGRIVEVVARLTSEASRTLTPMKELAGTLTSALVELSIDMRLIALNAQVRSVQGGAGTGLEQLAARTVEISHATTAVTTENFTELQILRDGIGEMLVTFGDFQTRGQEQLTGFRQGRSEIETRLHAMRDNTLNAFCTISETLENLHASTGKVSAALTGVPPCRDRFAEIARLLHGLHQRHGNGKACATIASRRRDYTMASQHAVHAAVFGSQTQTPPPDTDSELFAAPAPAPAPPAAEKKTAAAPPPADTFGDNAELF